MIKQRMNAGNSERLYHKRFVLYGYEVWSLDVSNNFNTKFQAKYLHPTEISQYQGSEYENDSLLEYCTLHFYKT